jgi:hypothetical protein
VSSFGESRDCSGHDRGLLVNKMGVGHQKASLNKIKTNMGNAFRNRAVYLNLKLLIGISNLFEV